MNRRIRPASLRNVDEETLALSTNPEFMKIINRSRRRYRRAGGISLSALRTKLGLPDRP